VAALGLAKGSAWCRGLARCLPCARAGQRLEHPGARVSSGESPKQRMRPPVWLATSRSQQPLAGSGVVPLSCGAWPAGQNSHARRPRKQSLRPDAKDLQQTWRASRHGILLRGCGPRAKSSTVGKARWPTWPLSLPWPALNQSVSLPRENIALPRFPATAAQGFRRAAHRVTTNNTLNPPRNRRRAQDRGCP